MPFTLEDFDRWYFEEHFKKLPLEEKRKVLESLPPAEKREVLESLPPEERLAGLSAKELRDYLKRLTAGRPSRPRKTRRKK